LPESTPTHLAVLHALTVHEVSLATLLERQFVRTVSLVRIKP